MTAAPRSLLAALVLLPLLVPALRAQAGARPLGDVERLPLPPLALQALAKEDAHRAAQGLPHRFAVPHDVALTTDDVGTRDALPGGELLWRLRVAGGPGTVSLNVGFSRYVMPPGGTLVVRAADGSARVRPFTAADNDAHGELWTPALATDEIVLELTLPVARLPDLELELGRIGQGYRGFGLPNPASDGADSGSCNVDVVCPEGDEWQLEIPSVAALQVGGFLTCSGVLLNDTGDSLTPNFLTADHCGLTSGAAPSVVVYWNYENSVCRPPFSPQSGGPGDGTLDEFNTGSVHLADYVPSDFTLVRLDDDPDPAFEVSWAGWDRTSSDAASAVAIHHPGVEEKRISFEFQPTTTTSYLSDAVPGDGTHIRVEDWDVGTTEGGSSGSPLFDPNHRVVGQLHGGFASCTSQTADWYGRLSVSWTGGGTSASRLSDWLDPAGTGALAVDTVSLSTLCSDAGTATFLSGAVSCASSAAVRVVDCGLNTNDAAVETTVVTIDSTSEPGGEAIVLTETSAGSGRFEGSVPTSTTDAPGVLAVADGDTVTLTYVDADDGMGGMDLVVTASVPADCTPPAVTGVTLSDVTAFSATIAIDADEPVTATVRFGTSCADLTGSADSTGEAAASNEVVIDGLQDETVYRYEVEIVDEAGNVTLDDAGGACYSLQTLPATEYWTEEFLSDFDLDGRSITFTPAPGPDGYTACVETIAALPTDPAGGTALSLTDDDSENVAVGGGQTVALYDVPYASVWVGSNGYVTFGAPDTDFSESIPEHFALPRVAPMYDDFNPSAGGVVSYRQLADRLAVTWTNVPEFGTGNQNTFQVELFFDGTIRTSWLGMAAADGIVGLSAGAGVPPDYIEENLGGLGSCDVICQTDLGFGGPGTATLSMCGGDLSTGTTADIELLDAAPSAPAFLVVGLVNDPTPLKGGTLVPVPVLSIVSFTTDGSGRVLLPGVPGGGGPATAYLQFVVEDGAQPQGFAFSNALEVVFGP